MAVHFFDNSSFGSHLRNKRGYFTKGTKDGVAHQASIRSQEYSMVTLLITRDLDIYQMIKGSHNSGVFPKFLQIANKKIGFNYTQGFDVLVLDNVALHKVEEIKRIFPHIDVDEWIPGQQLTEFSQRLLFLPAYSPLLNPIEWVFRRLKRRIKQFKLDGAQAMFFYLSAGKLSS